jgi:hypothetical protein
LIFFFLVYLVLGSFTRIYDIWFTSETIISKSCIWLPNQLSIFYILFCNWCASQVK